MNNSLTILATLLACLLLGACGQKGPLFLPGERSPRTELPELSREALEEAAREEDEPVVPNVERPPAEDDEAEPYVDPAAPPEETDH